jgi:GT2 family glycosyltransferase/glycosyltransferase involved in cell wall biosynthesis
VKRITAVVNYCSNERKFLAPCLAELRKFCDQIVVSYGDRFFDGSPEDHARIAQDKADHPDAEFVSFTVDPRVIVTSERRPGTTWYWHNVARVAGFLAVRADIEYVLFLDVDEIVESSHFIEFLERSDWQNYDALRFSAYWYFKSPRHQATTWEIAGLLVRKSKLTLDQLLQPTERNDLFEQLSGRTVDHVKGLDNFPLVHHYSWVRTKEEMLRKIESWGHKSDKNWPALVEAAFRSDGLPATDFVHDYRYRLVEPYVYFPVDREDAAKTFDFSSQKPIASVIIPVFNNLDYTRQCITSLFAVQETTSFEVIVVNNGSTDGTTEYLEQIGSTVRCLHLPQNLGFAKACNRGAQVALGDYVVFLNNDTKVLPNWLAAMVNCLESDHAIGLVGGLQIFPDTERVQQAGIVCGPNAMVYSIYNNLLPAAHPAVNKPRDFQFVAGSCMALRRTEFLALGGFDESYLNSCEDIDLCLRVRESGKRVHYCPASKIYHYESKTAAGHDKAGPNYRLLLERWRSKMPQDDQCYFAEDGFHYNPATNTLTPIPPAVVGKTEPKMTSALPHEKQSPRVAILSTYHQRCGLAAYAEFMVKALQEAGISPLILAEDTTATLAHDDENVIRCWTRDSNGGSRIAALMSKHQIELLHVNYGGYFALDGWLEHVLQAVRDSGVRVLITFHTTESSSPKPGALARLADLCYVHHAQNALELVALGCPPDRVEQIPLGMPALQITDIFENKLALNWDPAQKVVSTFGFVEPHKGILELINAIHIVNQVEDVHLLVIGGVNPSSEVSAAYLATCKVRVAELNLTQRVHFAEDYVEDEYVQSYLRASNVIVLNYSSRRYEASQSAAIALASGRPVVTSQAPAFDFPAALTLKTTDAFPLPGAILYLLRNPFVGRMMLNAVMDYEKTAGWPVVARRIADAYRRILSEPLKEAVDLLHFYATHPDDIYADALQRERLRWLKSKARGRILEIGPANGYVAEYVGAAAAVDIYRGRLHVASALRPETTFTYGNILDGLPFADHEFDQVLAPEIFEHVDFDDAVRALQECLRVGRSVLITMPCADKPDYNPDLVHVIEHRWIVNRGTVTELLHRAGCSDYVIDVSPHQDFYLVEIGTSTGRTITERASDLPTLRLDDGGEPLHVTVDLSCLEHEPLQNDDFSRTATALLPALMAHRPRWHWTLTSFRSPTSPTARRLIEQANGGFEPWASVTAQRPDVMLVTHPFVPELENLLLLAQQSQSTTAAIFSDLIPLQFPGVYLSSPDFKAHYTDRLGLLTKSCDLFLCQSQQTAQDMQVHLGLPSGRLRIVHGAAFPEFSTAAQENATNVLNRLSLLAGNYVVVPPPYLPHKNVPLAIVTFARVNQRSGRGMKLVLHGTLSPSFRELLQQHAAANHLAAQDFVLSGALTPEETSALYRQATLIFSPSSYEGFPQAVLNALACDVPVLTGANSAMAEILSAEHTVAVNDTDAVIQCLAAALHDTTVREHMVGTGRKLSAHYTWQRAAEKTAMYLAEFVGHRHLRQQTTAKARTPSPARIAAR